MKTSVKEIQGNWDLGFSLAKHVLSSEYLGVNEQGRKQFGNTIRSEPGEALYQLKYQNDWSQVEPLAAALFKDIFPRFEKVGLLIPMPASKIRAKQPVTEVTKALSQRVNLGVFDNILIKNAGGKQLKDAADKEEKVAILEGRFSISDEIDGDGPWNALLVDDKIDTGASLEAACNALRKYQKIRKIYVATISW